MPTAEQRDEERIHDLLVPHDDPSNLRAQSLACVRRAFEQEGVTADDRRRGCQGFAFVLQACPMREARQNPVALRELPSGERAVIERPPEGLGRGVFDVPAPVVVLLAAVLALLTLGYYALRLRKARRR
jgi:hypothetical protein